MRFRAGAFFIVALAAIASLYSWEQRKDTMLASASEPSSAASTPNAALNSIDDILKFRKDNEARLRGPDSWLSVVGLTWLKNGDNTIGSDMANTIVLPGSAPKQLGVITFGKTAKLKLTNANGVTVDDKPAKALTDIFLLDDDNGDTAKPTRVNVGTVTWFLIKRKNGVGVRIKDSDSDARKHFAGKTWFEPDLKYQITADWVAFKEPQTFVTPDILGNFNTEKSPGYAKFTVNGTPLELHATEEDGELFYVFRDKTAGHETYGAARFLHSALPKDGKVVIDFNKAVNPPCAFTHYATCPMPVKENILPVEIRAGELKPPGH